jgi:hypothetical protein
MVWCDDHTIIASAPLPLVRMNTMDVELISTGGYELVELLFPFNHISNL